MASVAAVSYAAGSATLAIYALSFWHYYVYWLAFRYGAVPLAVFKRDAVAMKTVSLAMLGVAYFSTPPDPLSLAAIALGFALNAAAASVLGSDRTYYGHEVAGLRYRRIRAFPYGWIPHPMLVGNMAAFGGTLINPEFRQQWWPLACAHVVLNLALLFMELYASPLRRNARPDLDRHRGFGRRRPLLTGVVLAGAGAALGGLAAQAGFGGADSRALASVGACAAIYAFVMFRWYEWPAIAPGRRRPIQAEVPR